MKYPNGVRIGSWVIPFRPVHFVKGWWSALAYFIGSDVLQRVYLPERDAMEWYEANRPAPVPETVVVRAIVRSPCNEYEPEDEP